MKRISSKRAKALAISPAVKIAVEKRDGGRCLYCGKPGLPEAHYIPRSKGGLGVPANILTLCRDCHDKFDNGPAFVRDGMKEYFAEYLKTQYPGWCEENLIYRKDGSNNGY